jgi:hypothetical protein
VTVIGLPSALALVIAPPPGPARVARADAVVLGRVVAHEDKDIEVLLLGAQQKTAFRIAIVQVNEAIFGARDAKQLRVAFVAPPPVHPNRPVLRTGGGGRVNLDIGRDGLFVLTKQPGQNFYQQPMYFHIVSASDANFDKEVKETRRLCKLLADPDAGLTAKDGATRFETAALLLYRYRTPVGGMPKQEPIDAGHSKLILKALLNDAAWNQPRKFGQTHPQELFLQLGLQPADGWNMPPRFSPQELNRLAQNWLRDNAEKYCIKRFVAN